MVSLLLRNLLPTSGEIFLDGVNINECSIDTYSRLFSCVYQDWQKYAVSINDYIAFGNLKKTNEKEKIELAAKKSTADSFITKFERKIR